MRPKAARLLLTIRRIASLMLVTALLAAVVAAFTGCSGWRLTGNAVHVQINECRTDQSYYFGHAFTSGGDHVLFENHDQVFHQIVFERWPFTGLPHTIVVQAGQTSHSYSIDQFCRNKAGADTFDFKIFNGEDCGVPPNGPGIIIDD